MYSPADSVFRINSVLFKCAVFILWGKLTACNPGKSNRPIYDMNWLHLELRCSCVHLDFLSCPLLQREFVCLSVIFFLH